MAFLVAFVIQNPGTVTAFFAYIPSLLAACSNTDRSCTVVPTRST